ncbi:unnamed protein product [Lymnaea stagnalis]|uniref:Uncharacterized protein n=1 Tax=Lymnaea stagnalis TaxID=6523 RepID=A0AAV2I205_LYMST
MLGLAVLDCPPLLCDNTDVTQDHVKSVGDAFFLPLCVKAYVHTNLTVTWNGLILSTSPNSSHRFQLKRSRRLLEWDVGVSIRTIAASDYGRSRLSVAGGEPLELVVHILKPNTVRNIYTKGLKTVIIIAVLTFVVVGGTGVVIHVICRCLHKLRDAIVGTISEQQTTAL